MKRLRQEFPSIKLMVDANSAYRHGGLAAAEATGSFYLMMIEQPLGWDDICSPTSSCRKTRDADLLGRMHSH